MHQLHAADVIFDETGQVITNFSLEPKTVVVKLLFPGCEFDQEDHELRKINENKPNARIGFPYDVLEEHPHGSPLHKSLIIEPPLEKDFSIKIRNDRDNAEMIHDFIETNKMVITRNGAKTLLQLGLKESFRPGTFFEHFEGLRNGTRLPYIETLVRRNSKQINNQIRMGVDPAYSWNIIEVQLDTSLSTREHEEYDNKYTRYVLYGSDNDETEKDDYDMSEKMDVF